MVEKLNFQQLSRMNKHERSAKGKKNSRKLLKIVHIYHRTRSGNVAQLINNRIPTMIKGVLY